MAEDYHKVTVELTIVSPEYPSNGASTWEVHYHGNEEQKQALRDAVAEEVKFLLDEGMVNDEEFEIVDVQTTYDGVSVKMTDAEQKEYDEAREQERMNWNLFQEEIDRRMSADITGLFTNNAGTYSMGNLHGPISQLDELAHMGFAQVVVGDTYSSGAILNPTNWDMFRMFCQALADSNNPQRDVFLEGLECIGTDDWGVATYRALTGS